MREVCFCGWSGDLLDRLPVNLDDDTWGLACPNCGQIDPLNWLPDASRRTAILEAMRRHAPLDCAA